MPTNQPTSPVQLLSGKAPWYPRHDAQLSSHTQVALRRVFDNVYQIAGTLLPLGAHAVGMGTVVVPAAPNPAARVPGCQLVMARAGLWQVTGVWSVQVLDAGDVGFAFTGSLLVSGLQAPSGQKTMVVAPTVQPSKATMLVSAQPETRVMTQVWMIRVNAKATAQMLIQKATGATGTHSLVDAANSSIVGVWSGL